MSEFKKSGDLNKLSRRGTSTRTVRIYSADTGVMTSKRGDDYLAISYEFAYTDTDQPIREVKTRPVFSKEARVVIESGPFSPDTEYVVTVGYTNGFPVWKKISPVIEQAAG